ncbi:MAG: serine/threonine protein kinase, partial [Lentisphaeria bacterium]|nr:serine/threonine protein kinase [Lentisphaeria bacterium]
ANTIVPGMEIGDFRIIRLLSCGGMGEVFLARQISLEREVALKVLQSKFINDREYIDSLYSEARAAAKLSHPNIVQAYAVGEDNGIFYFAMEYVRGDTFKSILKNRPDGKLEFKQAAQVIRDIAKALDSAWREQKLVHQDIKPDNIMLDPNGFAKLADLGLAKTAGSAAEDDDADEVLGTPQYISPEQLTGVPTDVRSDIYSLGATFFQFVTGRFPYVAKMAEDIAKMHVAGNLEPPKQFNPELPDELNRIIVKMMARYPEDRYQLPGELVEDLENFLNSSNTTSIAMPKLKLGGLKVPVLGGNGAAPAANAGAGGMKLKISSPAGTAAPGKSTIPPLGGAGAKPAVSKPGIPPLGGAGAALKPAAASPAATPAPKPAASPAATTAPKPAASPSATPEQKPAASPAATTAPKPAAEKPKNAVELKPEAENAVKSDAKSEPAAEEKKGKKDKKAEKSKDDGAEVKPKRWLRVIFALLGLLVVLAAAAVTLCILKEKEVKMGPVQPAADKVYELYLKLTGKEAKSGKDQAPPAEDKQPESAENAENSGAESAPAEENSTENSAGENSGAESAPAEASKADSVTVKDVNRELQESGVLKKYMTAFFAALVGTGGEDLESIAGEIRDIANKNPKTAREYEAMVKYFAKEVENINELREKVEQIKNVKVRGIGTIISINFKTGKYTYKQGNMSSSGNFFRLPPAKQTAFANGVLRRFPKFRANRVFYFSLLCNRLNGVRPQMWTKYQSYMPAALPKVK